MKKIVAIIQARCGSTRFPNKIFSNICSKPLIWHVINRLKYSNTINGILLATTTNFLDNKLYDWAIDNGVEVFRGSEDDVLNRYYKAAISVNADVIVRITADDPFKEPAIIDIAVSKLLDGNYDLVTNNNPPTYPEGLDVEVFTMKSLNIAENNSDDSFEREHVTQYFYRNPSDFRIFNIQNDNNLSNLRWTIDTNEDFEMVEHIYNNLSKDHSQIFYMNDILDYLSENPKIAEMNLSVKRSEMYKKVNN